MQSTEKDEERGSLVKIKGLLFSCFIALCFKLTIYLLDAVSRLKIIHCVTRDKVCLHRLVYG